MKLTKRKMQSIDELSCGKSFILCMLIVDNALTNSYVYNRREYRLDAWWVEQQEHFLVYGNGSDSGDEVKSLILLANGS